jgi:Holliday junction DNA helicase RuvA
MIGYLSGEVIFSDGKEVIIKTASGVGHQVYLQKLLVEGSQADVFISHVFKDPGQELFGFETLREKKLFEILTSVKGVGPKSAYSLITALGVESVIQSIQLENKKSLSKAPGIGAKAAAQICLDLSSKIQSVLMYSGSRKGTPLSPGVDRVIENEEIPFGFSTPILEEALMACTELGFREDLILAKAQRILAENDIQKPEQLVHLVLKEV